MKMEHRHCVQCGKVMAPLAQLTDEQREAAAEAARLAREG